MAYRNELVAYAVVGLAAAGALGFGCASIIGADEYKVAGGGPATGPGPTGPTGAGGSDTTTMSTTTGTTGGTGGTTCSGPTPAGQAMCGAGKTCNTDTCEPLTFACFEAGATDEGGSCMSKRDCAAGLTCIHYNTRYACRKLCSVNTDCPAGYLCTEGFTCGDNPDTAGKYCAKPCSDVVTPAGSSVCAAGFKCKLLCDTTTDTPLPPTCDFEAGPNKSGPCTSDDECAAGYFCLGTGPGGADVCTQGCRGNSDCTMGTCSGTLFCGAVATTYHYCQLSGVP